MKQAEFSITIAASRQTVWNTLWHDETFRQWAGIIDPGTYMIGELIQGAEVQFISKEGYGVTSKVEKLIPYELLVLKHSADTKDEGQNVREDEWTGGQESYRLTDGPDGTTLTVAFDVPPELEDYFAVNYPKALDKVKELAESS